MLRRLVIPGVFVTLAVIGLGCSGSPDATQTPEVSDEVRRAEAVRQLAFAYWEAFNSYDADQVLGYMEESYRQLREDEIIYEVGAIERFSVKLGVSEESPPQMVGDGEMEMYLTMKEPLGERRIRMAFREVAGEWKVIFSEQVDPIP